MIEEETKMYILIRTKHHNKWSKSEELRLKLLRKKKKNNACNKKKYSKVNVNAPRRKTRPLSWLERLLESFFLGHSLSHSNQC